MKIKRKRLTDFAVSIFVSMGTSEKHAMEVATRRHPCSSTSSRQLLAVLTPLILATGPRHWPAP